jgi:hypothetical protein
MFNYNKDTGLAYGVASGHTFSSLMEDIETHGDNVSFANFRQSYRNEVEALVKNLPIFSRERGDAVQDIMDALDDYVDYQGEEDNYVAEIDKTKYEMGWLGGAPLIWVTDSEWACYCKPCSPCVPGAGDLNSLGGSALSHCMPPSEWKVVFDEGYEEIPQSLIHISTGSHFDLWDYCGKKEEE